MMENCLRNVQNIRKNVYDIIISSIYHTIKAEKQATMDLFITKHARRKTVDHPKMTNLAEFCKKIADFLNLLNRSDINIIFISCYANQ